MCGLPCISSCATGFQWNCSEMTRPHSSHIVWLITPETSRQKTGNSRGNRMVHQSFTLHFSLSPLPCFCPCLQQSHVSSNLTFSLHIGCIGFWVTACGTLKLNMSLSLSCAVHKVSFSQALVVLGGEYKQLLMGCVCLQHSSLTLDP